MSKLPKSIMIVGKRWFQKSYGNTYYSAVAYVDGEIVETIDYAYGYGDQYEQDMFAALERNGHVPPREKTEWGGHVQGCPSMYCRDHLGISFVSTVSDVSRKKDL